MKHKKFAASSPIDAAILDHGEHFRVQQMQFMLPAGTLVEDNGVRVRIVVDVPITDWDLRAIEDAMHNDPLAPFYVEAALKQARIVALGRLLEEMRFE